jgi:hypothetical protein
LLTARDPARDFEGGIEQAKALHCQGMGGRRIRLPKRRINGQRGADLASAILFAASGLSRSTKPSS